MPIEFYRLEEFWGCDNDGVDFNHGSPQRFYITAEQEISADWRVRTRDGFVLPVHSQVLALSSSVMRDLLNSSADASEPIAWDCSIFHALVFLRLVYGRQVPGDAARDIADLLPSGHLEGVVRLSHLLGADDTLNYICHFVKAACEEQEQSDNAPLLARAAESLGIEPFTTACFSMFAKYIDQLRYGHDQEPSKDSMRITARCLALLGDSPALRAAAALAINPKGENPSIEWLMSNLLSDPEGPHAWRIQNFE